MKSKQASAIKLRATLGAVVVLAIILVGVGFYFAQDWLRVQAKEVHEVVLKSTAGEGNSQSLTELQKAISDRQPAVEKANSIMANSSNYTEQVINDLESHASQSGVKIADYNFSDSTQKTTATDAVPTPAIAGVRTVPITITMSNPVNFTNLLKFMKAIETNLPKMQITGINLTSGNDASGGVTVAPITIEVFVR